MNEGLLHFCHQTDYGQMQLGELRFKKLFHRYSSLHPGLVQVKVGILLLHLGVLTYSVLFSLRLQNGVRSLLTMKLK